MHRKLYVVCLESLLKSSHSTKGSEPSCTLQLDGQSLQSVKRCQQMQGRQQNRSEINLWADICKGLCEELHFTVRFNNFVFVIVKLKLLYKSNTTRTSTWYEHEVSGVRAWMRTGQCGSQTSALPLHLRQLQKSDLWVTNDSEMVACIIFICSVDWNDIKKDVLTTFLSYSYRRVKSSALFYKHLGLILC